MFKFIATIVFECIRGIEDFVRSCKQWCKTNADEPRLREWAQPRVEPMFAKKDVIQTPAIAHCQVVGKHHVVVGNNGDRQHLKVLGRLNLGGVNRVRPFGHAGREQEPVKCRLEEMLIQ